MVTTQRKAPTPAARAKKLLGAARGTALRTVYGALLEAAFALASTAAVLAGAVAAATVVGLVELPTSTVELAVNALRAGLGVMMLLSLYRALRAALDSRPAVYDARTATMCALFLTVLWLSPWPALTQVVAVATALLLVRTLRLA